MPVSLTEMTSRMTAPSRTSSPSATRIDSVTLPCFVYFTALFRRFVMIWRTRTSSPRKPSGSALSASTMKSSPLSRALKTIMLLTSLSTELN